jgi:hypothetical protein
MLSDVHSWLQRKATFAIGNGKPKPRTIRLEIRTRRESETGEELGKIGVQHLRVAGIHSDPTEGRR